MDENICEHCQNEKDESDLLESYALTGKFVDYQEKYGLTSTTKITIYNIDKGGFKFLICKDCISKERNKGGLFILGGLVIGGLLLYLASIAGSGILGILGIIIGSAVVITTDIFKSDEYHGDRLACKLTKEMLPSEITDDDDFRTFTRSEIRKMN